MISLVVLGSTGSIGKQTLDIVKKTNNEFIINGLSTNTNIELLEKQIDEFQIKTVTVFDKEKAKILQKKRPELKIYSGLSGLEKIVQLKTINTVVVAVSGKVGLSPTLAAIKAKKNIALANKETLVVSGKKVMKEVKKNKVKMRLIDSEHNAIAQILENKNKQDIAKIWITASGGPFLNSKYTLKKLEKVSPEEALNHPTWNMGTKISIDSATLANKGLEIIEAVRFFELSPEQIEVIIHPQSIIHSAVEFVDGSFFAELGATDMRRCIYYALTGKRKNLNLKKLSLFDLNLNFQKPDRRRFPCLDLAEKAVRTSEKACAIFNNANEAAVKNFLNKKIGFMDISRFIEKKLNF